jgi:phage shock protein A
MSFWSRLSRWWSSLWGSALDKIEDPEKILAQNIREMEEQIPAINENIAMIKANMTLQQNNLDKLSRKVEVLKSKIKAALQASRRDLALNYATTLEQVQGDISTMDNQVQVSKAAYEKALKVKEAFIKEKEVKRQEAMRAIEKHKQSQWQKKVADAMESFEVSGIDQTHDEMIQKIEQESALNEARMEMALDGMDAEGFDMEKEAEMLRANELLKQFELEMGIVSPEAAAEAEKTIGPQEIVESMEAELAQPEKTIGPKEKANK